MEITDIITIILAVWGAGLSTYLAFRQFRREVRKVKVSCQFLVKSASDNENERTLFVAITATNIGHRPVMITGLGFEMIHDHPDSDQPLQVFPTPHLEQGESPPLPRTLLDGEGVTVAVPYDPLAFFPKKARVKYISVAARDAEGNLYSAAIPEDIDRALNYGILDGSMEQILSALP